MTGTDLALTVDCRFCGADTTEPCIEIARGGWIVGREQPHITRLADAVAEARR